MKLVVGLAHSKTTKGAYRYDSVSETAPIHSVYIRKEALNGHGVPTNITLIVEPGLSIDETNRQDGIRTVRRRTSANTRKKPR